MKKAYQLKIALKSAKPSVWCRCTIPSGITFSQLGILLLVITGEQDAEVFEFEFYHKKIRLFEEQRVASRGADFYYDFMGASETFIDELLDTKDWFSLNCSSGNSYRITVENRIDDFAEAWASVQKYKGEWLLQTQTVLSDVQTNEMLKERYTIFYGEPDFRTSQQIQDEIKQGKYGLQGANKAIGKTDHYKKSSDGMLQEFAEKIVNHILSPSVMKKRMCTLSDEQIAEFERAIKCINLYRPQEEALSQLDALYDLDYIIIYEDNSVTVPDEVIHAYKKINTPEFHNLRKQIVWMQACLEMHAMIYGVAPIKILHRLYRKRPGFKVEREELLHIFQAIPDEVNLCVIREDKIILKEILRNDLYIQIEKSQGTKEFYIPDYREVIDCIENKYPSKEPAYQELKQFLSTEMQLEEVEAVDIVSTIWSRISLGYDFHDIMDIINERNICFSSEQALVGFSNIMMNVNNRTRMLVNRGYMPNELLSKRKPGMLDGQMPTIVPMSSMAANILGSSQKELEDRGFSVDLDSNAREIPVGVMKDGLSGRIETGTRKIYPNDPCPCGSGKKYKRCCGKN